MEVVKPFIDQEYRTLADREHTAMIGSSLGEISVSYTHLDVYKRQAMKLDLPISQTSIIKGDANSLSIAAASIVAVSYTHLERFKRLEL